MEDTATAAAPKLLRSVEGQFIENYIHESGLILQEARLSLEVAERLADYGFDDEELAIGMAMQERALQVLQASRGTVDSPTAAPATDLQNNVAKVREAYTAFRGIARAAFPDLSDRVNLRVVGEVPDDLQNFVTKAHEAYAAAAQPPYMEKLSKRGYPPAKLAELQAAVKSIAASDMELDAQMAAFEQEEGQGELNESYVALKEFMKELKGVARTIFRKEPDVLEQLGL